MNIKKDYQFEFECWLKYVKDEDNLKELNKMDASQKEDAFYRDLEFGTGGLRGVIGAGTNRINVYTVAKATKGLAEYLLKKYGESASVVVGYDSRIKSDIFAKTTASVFAANGIKVYLWSTLNPVPTVSFATRYLKASAGVMITASHNPAKYNGYKVYGADGCQITTEAAAEIYSQIEKIDIFKDINFGDFDTSLEEGKVVDLPQELLRKDRNIKNLMLQPDASFMPVKKLLFDFVNEEFDIMQSEFSLGITSELTRYICETEISQDCLDVEFMKNTVSKIIVLSDGNIKVRFINGKEISNTSEELK